MDKLIRDFKPHVINHHAAQIDVVRSLENPLLDIDINIKAAVGLVLLAGRYGVKRFIFASSGGAIYGDVPQGVVPDEEYLPHPMNPYGANKLTVDMYLTFMGVSYVSLRYANVYGPRQGLGGEAGVIGKFVSRALRGEPLYIFGDGYQTRDFVYVEDVAKANLLALHDLPDGIYNVSTGVETNLWQVVDAIKREIPDVVVEQRPPRPGDVRRSVMSSAKLQSYGWKPEVSLEEGIKRTLEWWRGRMV
jgi:UDP-glucose 4-epimerase